MVLGKATLKGVLRLEPGAKVQVQGLENRKELNGLTGSLLQFDPAKLRWGVQLADGKQIALKIGNLIPLTTEVAPAVEVPHLGPTPAVDDTMTCEAPEGYVAASAAAAATGANCNLRGNEERLATSATAPVDDVTTCETPEGCAAAAAAAGANCNVNEEELAASAKAAVEADNAIAAPTSLNDEEWPVLPTSADTTAKIQSGCWWDGGSAAKRFTEQLIANDPSLVSVCLVPPKRFNADDAKDICHALELNTACHELVASGHPLDEVSCEHLAHMLGTNSTLRTLSIGESSLGDRATLLFDGLAKNVSLTALDFEHKGLTVESCRSLAKALDRRQQLSAAPLGSLRLSRNKALGTSLAEGLVFQGPRELMLCECGLADKHGDALGLWVSRGVADLDLRDNSNFGSDALEAFMRSLMQARDAEAPALRKLRLDGCAIGDDGIEVLADALKSGLELDELFLERCEITLLGCEFLATALQNKRRLRTLSVRANVIGDEGCALLGRCAERLDLSSTSLSGQVLGTLGEQDLVSLELFSNPTLGPSVRTWCSSLQSSQWQRLEYLDLTGCALKDDGFQFFCKALMQRQDLMPALTHLAIGANDVTEDDATCDLVDRVSEARKILMIKWQNS